MICSEDDSLELVGGNGRREWRFSRAWRPGSSQHHGYPQSRKTSPLTLQLSKVRRIHTPPTQAIYHLGASQGAYLTPFLAQYPRTLQEAIVAPGLKYNHLRRELKMPSV